MVLLVTETYMSDDAQDGIPEIIAKGDIGCSAQRLGLSACVLKMRRHCHGRMILQVGADARQVLHHRDAGLLKNFRGSDPGALQQCWAMQRSGSDDDLVAAIFGGLTMP